MKPTNEQAWRIADSLRDSRASMHMRNQDIEDVAAAAESAGEELTREVWRSLARWDRNERLLPMSIITFLAHLAEAQAPSQILQLWSGEGEAALAMKAASPRSLITAIDPQRDAMSVAQYFDAEDSVRWIHARPGDVDRDNTRVDGTYDLIVLTAPFGARKQRLTVQALDGRSIEVYEEEGRLDLVAYAKRLSQNGMAVMLTTPTVLSSKVAAKYRQALASVGLWLNSSIALPAGTFAPYTSMPAVLAIFGRTESDDVWMAELPESDEGQQRFIENMAERRKGRTPEAGVLVGSNELASLSAVMARFDVEQGLRATGMSVVQLGEVAKITRADREGDSYTFEPADNSLYLPLAGFGAARLDPPEKITSNWVQVTLDPELAVASFVARWLSTSLGKRSRESLAAGATVQHLSIEAAHSLPLALPPLDDQYRCLALETQLIGVASDVQQMRDDLWLKPRKLSRIERQVRRLCPDDDMSEWIETLPWPMATVARAYFAVQDERQKVEALFRLFEATAEFHATILLSAFSADQEYLRQERDSLLGTPDERRGYFERASLGGWTSLALRLSKEVRRHLSGGKDDSGPGRDAVLRWFGRPSEQWLSMITDAELYSTLDDARKRRNDWKGHGGAAGEAVIRSQLAELEELLGLLRAKIADKWSYAQLLSPTPRMSYNDGVFETTVDRLVGVAFPFQQEKVVTSEPLESERLHILPDDSRTSIQLLPLVRLMPAPRTAANTCYFYNRVEGEGLRYLSYNYEEDPETVVPLQETAANAVLEALGLDQP